MTQVDAAETLDIGREFYNRLERGKAVPREPAIIERIAEYLSLDLDTAYALSGRVTPDIHDHLAGNERALKQVRMLIGLT